ncbi:MAG: adenine deaminase [Balneolaceae bacterium]
MNPSIIMHTIKGIIVDPVNRRTFNGAIQIKNGEVDAVTEVDGEVPRRFIMPGFVDSHIHIESSMLVPSEFARMAVHHGTVATVSDPHEIANVCGMEGVRFMIENGSRVPLKFYFGAPSCVPATPFETSGAVLDVDDVAQLLDRDDVLYLAEMMNWPGALQRDEMVMAKINAALERGKPVDGHAPGVTGSDARRYAEAGITTDHESSTLQEARDKADAGMKVAIREGSAAKNFEALIPILGERPEMVMFCSDDKHPDDLLEGHINQLAARAVAKGYPLYDVLRACNVHAVEHYGLPVGLLQPGDPADFVVVRDLTSFEVDETWIEGECVYADGNESFRVTETEPINQFSGYALSPEQFAIPASSPDAPRAAVRVIVAEDGELVTNEEIHRLPIKNGAIQADPENDILKMVVVNRYQKAEPAVAFIRNFGMKSGAIASSVAHDSHNIIAVGCDDEAICRAVNALMESGGGISVADGDGVHTLALPVGGLMSTRPADEVGGAYKALTRRALDLGSTLNSPFMTISFMALLVIPALKLSDKGLFDGASFEFQMLEVNDNE